VLQMNDELARANVPPAKRDAAGKQLLESLIDRQLLQTEALRDKVDRDPAVMQAVERVKSQIYAQTYMQRRLANVAKPTKEEIDKYYLDHPDYFSERKIYELDELVLPSKDLSPEFKAAMNGLKSIDEAIGWLKDHHLQGARGTVMKSSVDLAPQLLALIKDIKHGHLFALQQGESSVIVGIRNIREDPAKPDVADPQINKFLIDQRNQEAVKAELARLRATAKIEYLNKKPDAPAEAVTPALLKPADGEAEHTKKGVADL